MKKISMILLLCALVSMTACRNSQLAAPTVPRITTTATTQPEETEAPTQEQPEADFSSWDDVVELINRKGDTTTAYLLADGTYMDRVVRVFIYDGGERWMCGDEEWNRAPESAPEISGEPAVSTERAVERFISQRPDAVIFEDAAGEYAEKYVFWAKEELRDFCYQEVAVDVTEDGELYCNEKKNLYTRETLTPDDVLVISLQIEGTIPNRAIEYIDSNGVSHCYCISLSGFDDALVLIPVACG